MPVFKWPRTVRTAAVGRAESRMIGALRLYSLNSQHGPCARLSKVLTSGDFTPSCGILREWRQKDISASDGTCSLSLRFRRACSDAESMYVQHLLLLPRRYVPAVLRLFVPTRASRVGNGPSLAVLCVLCLYLYLYRSVVSHVHPSSRPAS